MSKFKEMKKEDLRIVFMGTPEFAVETLSRLVEGFVACIASETLCPGAWFARVAAREDERPGICFDIKNLSGRLASGGGFPHVARGGVGDASLWNI